MKTIKLSIASLSLTVLVASCSNNTATNSSSADSTSSTISAPVTTPTTQPSDTDHTANNMVKADTGMTGSNPNTKDDKMSANSSSMNKNGSGGKKMKVEYVNDNGGDNRQGNRSVSAARTGNTNGIKSAIKKDSLDNMAGFGGGK